MQSKNARIASSQNNAESQVTIDGNDVLLNANVERNSSLVSSAGIRVDRISYGQDIDARFYWDEASMAWTSPNAILFDNIHFGSLNDISLVVLGTDPFYIGNDEINLGLDKDSIQSRGTSYVGGKGRLGINELGGDVIIGETASSSTTVNGFEVNILGGNSIDIAAPTVNIDADDLTMVGDITIGDENAIRSEFDDINIHGNVLINGAPIVNTYTQASAPDINSDVNINQGDIWISTFNNDIYYFDGSVWVNTSDAGTFTGT